MDQYNALFAEANSANIVAEATAATIFDQGALPRVRAFAPGARIIAMVRDPAGMTISWHAHCVRQLDEDISDLPLAWAAMADRRAGRRVPGECRDALMLDYHYIASLGTQLERVYDLFPPHQIYIGFLDDFVLEPRRAWLQLLAFLGIQDDGRAEFSAENVGYMPDNVRAYRAIRKVSRAAKRALRINLHTGVVSRLTRNMRRREANYGLDAGFLSDLRASFEPEIIKLERLTGRDLSRWMHFN